MAPASDRTAFLLLISHIPRFGQAGCSRPLSAAFRVDMHSCSILMALPSGGSSLLSPLEAEVFPQHKGAGFALQAAWLTVLLP